MENIHRKQTLRRCDYSESFLTFARTANRSRFTKYLRVTMTQDRHESGIFDDNHRLLFVAERYPPSVGGQERLNYGIYSQLRRRVRTHLLTPGIYLKLNLQKLWFGPYVIISGLILGYRHRLTHVHISSARIAFLGYVLCRLRRVALTVSVHGLDITLRRKTYLYKALVPYALRRYDRIICNSHSTMELCLSLGAQESQCAVAYPGVDTARNGRAHSKSEARNLLLERHALPLKDHVVLVTVGRLVKRKGVAWFLENVFPELSKHTNYIILGSGPELLRIEALIEQNGWSERISILKQADDSLRDLIYDAADLFVMPNVVTPGDREGFGIVNIEAGMHDLPVVASGIEGIRDAIIDGETGRLVKDSDQASFLEAIDELLSWHLEPGVISGKVAETYSLQASGAKYAELLGLRATNSDE